MWQISREQLCASAQRRSGSEMIDDGLAWGNPTQALDAAAPKNRASCAGLERSAALMTAGQRRRVRQSGELPINSLCDISPTLAS